ncbi:NAD(P)/FAD-dependent oxidoreductase [Thalassorhabdomicrobium marinisediminis]|uniref:NAD(P)/FAD-dependent oxidoreductase n=1 Tax=Thalassorhabdomicrobium marinisediminis TaxID=2170577 RepID=UPI002493253E|nr:FAD-dependent oxidoreductase [Thalassorhabdomicrobium marinisediminis]
MPLDQTHQPRKRIAVIGAGISGMAAAYELARDHAVVLFEAEKRLGGHARTRMGGKLGDQPVDTGFIVFNYENYPHLTALFDTLDVPVVPSNMSFGASIRGGAFEYGLASLGAMFAQGRNAANPKFLRMIRDILNFNKNGLRLSNEPGLTVRGLIEKLGAGPYFRDYYLLPLSGAIWSTPTEQVMDFPAHAMMTFFDNHALLGIFGQHQWYTVKGGSQEYVSRLGLAMADRGVVMRLGTPVDGVRRTAKGVHIKAQSGEWEAFDEVIFATHSDDSLHLLSDPTPEERAVLGAIRYQPNRIVLHSDEGIMPKRKAVWSSWIYSEDATKTSERIDLTYWMNKLQPWLREESLFVTLNTTREIKEHLIWDEVTLRHPVYDLGALAAQKAAVGLNGANNTWYCGAWMKNGFHEDGIASAMDVVEGMRGRAAVGVAAQ